MGSRKELMIYVTDSLSQLGKRNKQGSFKFGEDERMMEREHRVRLWMLLR